jgi:hypothetical protein
MPNCQSLKINLGIYYGAWSYVASNAAASRALEENHSVLGNAYEMPFERPVHSYPRPLAPVA